MVKKGEVLSTLPDAPLPLEIVRDLNSNDQILLAKPLPDATAGIDEDDPADVDGADEETTRRIAVQTPMGGYLVEYLPPDGWVVIRSVTPEEWSEDEIADTLMEMAAETPSAEYLADLMQTGYDLFNDHNTVAVFDVLPALTGRGFLRGASGRPTTPGCELAGLWTLLRPFAGCGGLGIRSE